MSYFSKIYGLPSELNVRAEYYFGGYIKSIGSTSIG